MTQRDVLAALQPTVSRQQLSNWENGRSTIPVDKLAQLAATLNVKIHEFFCDEEERKNATCERALIEKISHNLIKDVAAAMRSRIDEDGYGK